MGSVGCLWRVLLLLLVVGLAACGNSINVTYDQRALIIDGQRRMLISAGIHYPRATPEVIGHLYFSHTCLIIVSNCCASRGAA
jgi:hypothetical protein